MWIVYVLLFLAHFSWAQGDNSTCRSPECLRLSEHYRANMNTSVRPCDNFYEFACGNYAKNQSIPPNHVKNSLFSDMQREFDKELMDLFEKSDFENSSYAMKQAKIYYNSCMNQMAHEHYQTLALEAIPTFFGGWHLLNQSTVNGAWEVLAGNMTMAGKNPIIKPVFEVLPSDSEKFILHLAPLKMTLHKFSNYFEERANGTTAMELYEQYIPELLQSLGVNMDKNTMILIRDIIEFEKRLVNITYKEDPLIDNSKLMTYGEIKKPYQNIKWEKFFNKDSSHPLAGIPDSLLINVTNPVYFKKLNLLIIKENPSTIHNYLMWQLLAPLKMTLHKFSNYFEERANGTTAMELYEQYIPELLQSLGVNMDKNTMILIRDIIEFEKRLVNITYKEDPLIDNSKLMTYGEIKKPYQNIKWEKFFNKDSSHPLAGIPDSLLINVTNPVYFKKLNLLIIKENPSTIHNYLMWQLVNGFIWLLHPKYQKPRERLYWKLNRRPPTSSDIRKKCIFDVKLDFAIPLADELIRKRFKDEDRNVVERMTQEIKDVMKKELENADWMEEVTRKEALKKLDKMGTKLEYLDSILNGVEIQKYYESFELADAHYGPNAYWLTFKAQRELLSRLDRKPDIDWNIVLFRVNAFYIVNFNKIVIPAGILRFPMFVGNAPPFVNYGSIGVIIGHEVTHGYDSQSSHYDEHGNKRDWWDPVTWMEFKNRSQCFIDQYGKEIEPISGKKHNGLNVLGEGIGDNGGLRIAYQAYLEESKRTEDYRKLPGLEDYTSDQMFFIAFANTFCEISKPETIGILLNGAHSIGATRVNVPVRNFEKFSKVFECGAESAMKEKDEDKCRVW